MKITCPSCAADYNVPGTLAAGRVVRCAKCGTEWAPVAAVPVEVAPPPPLPAPPEPEPAVPNVPARLVPPLPERPERHLPLLLAWVGSLVVVVAALVMAFVLREAVMQAWPPSQRVYGVLGLRAAASADTQGNVVK